MPYDGFATALDHLAAQLRLEHQREVDDLYAEVLDLRTKLSLLSRPDAEGKTKNKIRNKLAPSHLQGQAIRHQQMPGPAASASSGPAAQGVLAEALEDAPADVHEEAPPDAGEDLVPSRAEEERPDGARQEERVPHRNFHLRSRSRGFVKRMHSGGYVHADSSLPAPYSNPTLALIQRVANTNWFEVFFSGLIVLNMICMAIQSQYQSRFFAEDYDFITGQRTPDSERDQILLVFDVLEVMFGLLFTIEIVCRLIGFRVKFAYDFWNWVDITLIIIWLSSYTSVIFPFNPMLFRLLRIVKIVRLLRLARKFKQFDALFLMVTALAGSVSILFWMACLLSMIVVFLGLLIHELLVEYYLKDTAVDFGEREEIYKYFGSITRSLFSIFEITLTNYAPISRALVHNVTEWFVVLTLFHRLAVGFALVGIMNGVFIQETFKAASEDNEVMVRKAQIANRTHTEKMRLLFETADENRDGKLDIAEFRGIFDNPSLKSWLSSMDFNPEEADSLFHMMNDRRDGFLTMDDVTRGVAKFKGSARTIDLHILMRDHEKRLEEQIGKLGNAT